MTESDPIWVLFQVPCPTPDGRSAKDLYQKRVDGITPEMRASAATHGCTFHRAWYAADGSAFYGSPTGCRARAPRVLRRVADRRRAWRGRHPPRGRRRPRALGG